MNPEVLVAFFRSVSVPITWIGLETSPLSQLHGGELENRYDFSQ